MLLRSPALLLALGCLARGEPEPGAVPDTSLTPELTDSLVLSAPGGVTVWLTEGRAAADSQGNACVERSIEIRHDSTRQRVPLLYTVSLPFLLNDSTIRAELADRCRPARSYRVNLRTAMPTPLDSGGPKP